MRVASWWLKDFVTGPVAAENCRAQTSYSTGENSVVLGGWWVATYIICCFGFGGWWEELWCWWGWWVMGDGRLRKRFLEVQVGVWVFRSNNYCCWSGQIQQLFLNKQQPTKTTSQQQPKSFNHADRQHLGELSQPIIRQKAATTRLLAACRELIIFLSVNRNNPTLSRPTTINHR